ncbi:hypothetical protein K491DRAFT_768939 [Lophiostoma macrostomum CBS 122681]|uniref:F-box domain-containing protein n=1 Tax=Lophiostoma macrostomum CBS 122681 TaxID=1314788 RepID=A0A6A6T754_9PLEO|nr:hypothetical protein K491DRAFT_768939 [Lophiostoma macrostomum CBS 122681]
MAYLNRPSSSTAFNKLPIELNKEIAHYLESDEDICNFRLICQATHDAIDGDNGSFWRAIYRETYAYVAASSNDFLKKDYQCRRKYLNWGVIHGFSKHGNDRVEVKVIQVIKSLILDSYQGQHGHDEFDRPRCPNQEQLTKFICDSKNFLGIKPQSSSSKPNLALIAVQIMCAQLMFEGDDLTYDIIAFDISQRAVYASMKHAPMFVGPGKSMVNMEWTLHCLNFFRHHMVKEEVQSLFHLMSQLEPGDKPSAWREPLRNGCYPLSRNWKGTYAYLEAEELTRIRKTAKGGRRNQKADDYLYMDKNVESDGQIQLSWPQSLESRLNSLRETMPPKQSKAQHRGAASRVRDQSIRLSGHGLDADDDFFASGWLNPLIPQYGIPGWQRVTFMKHFVNDLDNVLNDDLWAYEGVVLPGGRMMFGRWWYASIDPADPHYGDNSGPFMLWAVDSDPNLEVVSDYDN